MIHTYLKKNERKAQIRNRFVVIFAAFFAALILFVFGGSCMDSHQVQASSNETVLYKSIRVDAGDTLWNIADEYMGTMYEDKNVYIDEIKSINHITDADLQAGSYIIVPYHSIAE